MEERLAKPLALDITGTVRDPELPPLSPYSVKYSGYGIVRGKISFDIGYLVPVILARLTRKQTLTGYRN